MAGATLRACSARAPLAPRASRSGVTLIELLITIMIISILAAAVLGVAAVAGETAREAKTRTIISRIHTLLMQHYDTYTTRRVKLRQPVLYAISSASGTVAQRGRIKSEARLYALREMMLMEVPDRWSDVVLNNITNTNPQTLFPIYLDVTNTANGRTELANLYLRTFRRIAAGQNKIRDAANTVDDILQNQGAECLYLVVMNACGDGEARTLFPESSIGDADGDGAQEFLDGWGHPIEFVRWAPGFESDIQVNANDFGTAPVSNPTGIPAWVSAAGQDHDPFDLYRADQPAFRLVPLVYSAGRDEDYGLVETPPGNATWRGIADTTAPFDLNSAPKLLPWKDRGGVYVGTGNQVTKASTDNLTNHSIGTR